MKQVNPNTPATKPQQRSKGPATPSIIGNDVTITGNIVTKGEVQLDGAIDGDLVCGSLTMGETGSVRGTVKAETVVIRGAVKGEVQARSVRLEQTSVIEGNVFHESLSVEAGAKISGQFSHAQKGAAIDKINAETAPIFSTPPKEKTQA